MRQWMLERPPYRWRSADERAFSTALASRNSGKLPKSLPRWTFLEWLVSQGYLLHGSNRPDLDRFEPRTPLDLSPDEFSKLTAVFASSDGIWAMMYALRNRTKVKRMLNMALQIREGDNWSPMRYFLSLAPLASSTTEGRSLLCEGSVYVLPACGFEQMPAYDWPGLAEVLEPHWASPQAVYPIMRVPVSPEDFPLPVRTHDAASVDALSQSDPWGFPWLDSARV